MAWRIRLLVEVPRRHGQFRRHGRQGFGFPRQAGRHDPRSPRWQPRHQDAEGCLPEPDPAIGSGITETTFADANVLVSFLPIKGLPRDDWYLGVQIDRDLAYASVGEFRTAAAVATLVGVVAMIAILAALLSRLVVRPVVDMTGVMGKLAGGDVSAEIPGTARKDEIGQMAAAVAVFRDNIIERGRLAREADETRTMTEQERRNAKLPRRAKPSRSPSPSTRWRTASAAWPMAISFRASIPRLPATSIVCASTSTPLLKSCMMRSQPLAGTRAPSMAVRPKSARRPTISPAAPSSRQPRLKRPPQHLKRSPPPSRTAPAVPRKSASW